MNHSLNSSHLQSYFGRKLTVDGTHAIFKDLFVLLNVLWTCFCYIICFFSLCLQRLFWFLIELYLIESSAFISNQFTCILFKGLKTLLIIRTILMISFILENWNYIMNLFDNYFRFISLLRSKNYSSFDIFTIHTKRLRHTEIDKKSKAKSKITVELAVFACVAIIWHVNVLFVESNISSAIGTDVREFLLFRKMCIYIYRKKVWHC